MLMKPHQSAGEESQGPGAAKQSAARTELTLLPAQRHSVSLSVRLSHSSSRFIRVVCPRAKPSSAARRKETPVNP